MSDFKKVFQTEYARLNKQQKQAVGTIDGPVMVIAGAGTGKTQTIALRIANILLKTDTPPHSILCLTFTDNAAFNMRQRLLSLIGPTAYSVQIHTFHSFCNSVIGANPSHFPQTNLKSIEEIDKINIITNIIDKLPLNSPLKPRGAPLFYLKDIISTIQTLKREGISPKFLNQLISRHRSFVDKNLDYFKQIKALRFSKGLETDLLQIFKNILDNKSTPIYFKTLFSQKYQQYQHGFYTSGKAKNPTINFKNDLLSIFEKVNKNLDKQTQLQFVYRSYQRQLKAKSYYDFDDMINFVTNKFSQDPDFLRTYQEQIHYILVDEFQDSNNSQIKLLHQLSSYFDKPNLFVVGDDDQSIFRFQGASVENILSFYQKYSPQTFVLVNNYRSHQLILDSSHSLISKNQTQIKNLIEGIDKNLISQVDYDPDPINLYQTQNSLEEAVTITNKIVSLLDSGTKPDDIAILYRQHTDADIIKKLLQRNKINFTQTKNNLLARSHINYLIRILLAVVNPIDSTYLYSFLALPHFDLSPLTFIKILHKSKTDKLSLVDYLYSKNLKSKKIKTLIKKLADCHLQSKNLNLDQLFIYILDQFSYLSYINGLPNSFLAMTDLYSFFSYLKSFDTNHPQAKLTDFVDRLNLLLQNNLSIPQSSQANLADSLNLLTVHGAKGLEFDHVFIINCINGRWGNNRHTDKLPLPLGIVKTDLETDPNQEDRRLFYVALTRAKKQIYLSYSDTDQAGRLLTPSQFIFEIDPKLVESISVNTKLDQKLYTTILSTDKSRQMITDKNRQYLLNYLKNKYKFNITHLNSYLNCPHCFYYKNILRVPLAKTSSLSFGTAIHTTLAYLYNNPNSSLTKLSKVFNNVLKTQALDNKEFDYYSDHGQSILKSYLDNHQDLNANYLIEQDFSQYNIHLDNVPLTGKIDKIKILPTKTGTKQDIEVTDFKTGKSDNIYSKIAPRFDHKAGSYFRQILFYKLLVDLNPKSKYHLKTGFVEFIEPNKKGQFVNQVIKFSEQDLKTFKKLIKDTYQNILDLKFPINPDCRNSDHLHDLI